jgi:hypothetical protein
MAKANTYSSRVLTAIYGEDASGNFGKASYLNFALGIGEAPVASVLLDVLGSAVFGTGTTNRNTDASASIITVSHNQDILLRLIHSFVSRADFKVVSGSPNQMQIASATDTPFGIDLDGSGKVHVGSLVFGTSITTATNVITTFGTTEAILTNSGANNALNIRNNNASGSAAIAFLNNSGSEHMAVGYNNSSVATPNFAGRATIEASDLSGSAAPVDFAILQTGVINGSQTVGRIRMLMNGADGHIGFYDFYDSTVFFDMDTVNKSAVFSGYLQQKPRASVSLSVNGTLEFEATSNTTLTAKYRGSDGTTRSNALTLS